MSDRDEQPAPVTGAEGVPVLQRRDESVQAEVARPGGAAAAAGRLSRAADGTPLCDGLPLAALRACPHCDALYRLPSVAPRERASCPRCHALLIAPKSRAFSRVIAFAVASVILMAGAIFWPFLDLTAQGMHSRASVLDAVTAFAQGIMFPLSLAVGALIVVIPSLRLALLLYTVLPMLRGGLPWPRAGEAFRLADALRPWSMAEIFLIGVAVALVKVAGIAQVHPGPAFWALCGLVVVGVLQETAIDKETIWQAIERRGAGAAPAGEGA